MTAQISSRGAIVYCCDVCHRSIRVPANNAGIDLVARCCITQNCQGKLHKISTANEINTTPSVLAEVDGLRNWTPRRLLFTHNQLYKSSSWTVIHNLESKPSVHVFVDALDDEGHDTIVNVIPASIVIEDSNTVTLNFSVPQSGTAQCVSFASSQTTLGAVSGSDPIMLTNHSELTIATLSQAVAIDVDTTYDSPSSTVGVQYVGIRDVSVNSAWSDVNRIYVDGKTYKIRSFNIVAQQLAPAAFSEHKIVNGSTIAFTGFSSTPGDNLIVLSASPHTTFDRIVTSYIDIAAISPTLPETYYDRGELYIESSLRKNIYPPIVIVD